MLIESIEINNFRNIQKSIFKPGKNINLLFGENANGKTSYIESIYSISNLKSFRTSNLNEVININNRFSTIQCNYIKNKCNEILKLEIKKSSKKYSKNFKNCKIDDYLWSLFSIEFKPEDIFIISGSPNLRRELIDKSIFYIEKKYLKDLKKLNKIIENKNKILKTENISNIEEWNELIAKYSSIIIFERNKYINRINKIFKNELNKFGKVFKISTFLDYKIEDIKNIYVDELYKNIDKEIRLKYSIVGAHRNNIEFYIDENNLKIFGSQGQKRSFILLYKSAQIIDFENNNKFKPVLLLDDMASELDNNKKNIFNNLIENFTGQTFITSTDKKLFYKSDKVERFCVEDGKIYSFS